MSIAIVDSGGANIASLRYALQRLGHEPVLSVDAQTIRRSSHVLLPGVGAAAVAMRRLESHGLATLIPRLEQPVLGICLGMQLLFEGSDEGDAACLGVLPGRVRRLEAGPGVSVPHMGWNRLEALRPSPLLDSVSTGSHVYFLHSYAVTESPAAIAATQHGRYFVAALAHGNFYGTQFHPERSGATGARILRNFLALRSPCS